MSDTGSSTPDQDGRIAALEAQLHARDRVIDLLRAQLARVQRMTFGTSSEKLVQEIAQLELTLEEVEAEAALADERAIHRAARLERCAPVRGLPPHLPREDVVHEPATGSCT